VLERWPIAASATVSVKQVGRYRRLRVVVTNDSPMVDPRTERDVALRRSLLSAHWLLSVDGGRFVSLLDPPADAREAVAGCRNDGVWPVLVGQGDENDVVLVSPIILYDHPEIAPESAGDLFDATEIDEILTLRILTLTDEEKREARATDERARAIIERSEALPPEIFERLHGAVREVGLVSWSGAALEQPDDVPTFGADPFAVGGPFWEPTAGIEPDRASVAIGGVFVSRGSAVRLRPGPRGDTIDTFLAGRVGHVEAIFESVDEETYVAVTIDDDPAAELHAWYGRYFYFRPSELEPLDADDLAAGPPAASVTEQAR
jgi:hypothetical protein